MELKLEEKVVERVIGGRTLRLSTGLLAKQAAGSAVVQYGETVVLSAATTAPPRFADQDFFPLMVDYREKTYAAGKFPGGFFKREKAPSTKEILTMRLADRPIRPLFPDGFVDEVLIQSIVLSADMQNDPDILSIIGASAALSLSNLPFEGPIGAVRIGMINADLIVFPPNELDK
ncbi:MAG: polyribonucleotide nucleotidyltransferase, partial [Planctomycetes bacterium]|nr:polyribonucleotide nucleotidyltransferase [Planctomycetota bacterium]